MRSQGLKKSQFNAREFKINECHNRDVLERKTIKQMNTSKRQNAEVVFNAVNSLLPKERSVPWANSLSHAFHY